MNRFLTLPWLQVKLDGKKQNYLEVAWVEKRRHIRSEKAGQEVEKGNWICKAFVCCCPSMVLGSPALHCWGSMKQICTTHVKSASVATTVEGECFSWMAEKKT